MRKSVLIIISLVFVIAVALVSFLGVNHKTFHEIVSVSSVSFVGDGIQIGTDGTKQIVLRPDENGVRQYQIKYSVTPDEATDTTVSFGYDDKNGLVNISEDGLVTFQRAGTVIVTVEPNDGSDCSDTLKIIFR